MSFLQSPDASFRITFTFCVVGAELWNAMLFKTRQSLFYSFFLPTWGLKFSLIWYYLERPQANGKWKWLSPGMCLLLLYLWWAQIRRASLTYKHVRSHKHLDFLGNFLSGWEWFIVTKQQTSLHIFVYRRQKTKKHNKQTNNVVFMLHLSVSKRTCTMLLSIKQSKYFCHGIML